jgi:hypothetical protein
LIANPIAIAVLPEEKFSDLNIQKISGMFAVYKADEEFLSTDCIS